MWLPRPRFTIAHLMVLVVIAGLVSTGIVVRIERNRRIAALQVALANCVNAKLSREVAEIAFVEYTEGIYKQDLQTVDNEIALAKSDLERAFNPRGPDERRGRAGPRQARTGTAREGPSGDPHQGQDGQGTQGRGGTGRSRRAGSKGRLRPIEGGQGEFMVVDRDESLCGRVGGILNMLNHQAQYRCICISL